MKDFKTNYFEKAGSNIMSQGMGFNEGKREGRLKAYYELFPYINDMRRALELHKQLLDAKNGQRLDVELVKDLNDKTKIRQALKNLYDFVEGNAKPIVQVNIIKGIVAESLDDCVDPISNYLNDGASHEK